MTGLYTDVNYNGSQFLSTLFCLAYPNGNLVYIKNATLIVEDQAGRVQKSYPRSRDEIVNAFARYFPQIPESMVKAAIDNENVKLDYTKNFTKAWKVTNT